MSGFVGSVWTVSVKRRPRRARCCSRAGRSSEGRYESNESVLVQEPSAAKAFHANEVVRVRVEKPIGAVFEETRAGLVYVAEVIEGSNAELTGKIRPGWVVKGVSLPFGDELTILAPEDGLSRLIEFVREREGDTVDLELQSFPGGLEKLEEHSMAPEPEDTELVREAVDYIYSKPYLWLEEEEEEEALQDAEIEKLNRMTPQERMQWYRENYPQPDM